MTGFKLRVGSRAQVMHGTARITGGGLRKKDLKYNKRGKIVSRKASRTAKRLNKLVKGGYITRKGVFGVVRKGGANAHIPTANYPNTLVKSGVATAVLPPNLGNRPVMVKERPDGNHMSLADQLARFENNNTKNPVSNTRKVFRLKQNTTEGLNDIILKGNDIKLQQEINMHFSTNNTKEKDFKFTLNFGILKKKYKIALLRENPSKINPIAGRPTKMTREKWYRELCHLNEDELKFYRISQLIQILRSKRLPIKVKNKIKELGKKRGPGFILYGHIDDTKYVVTRD